MSQPPAVPSKTSNRPTDPPPIRGLVLCGGRATRLGRDKGTLDYHGRPQAVWLHDLLRNHCEEVLVSIRPDQAASDLYRTLPTVVDLPNVGGPAAGLLAAWQRAPESAWLVVAADLPLVDGAMLEALLEARDPSADATAFRHADGTPEPLCTLWEPKARAAVLSSQSRSLRRILDRGRVAYARVPSPERLSSVNTPEDDVRARRWLRERRRENEPRTGF